MYRHQLGPCDPMTTSLPYHSFHIHPRRFQQIQEPHALSGQFRTDVTWSGFGDALSQPLSTTNIVPNIAVTTTVPASHIQSLLPTQSASSHSVSVTSLTMNRSSGQQSSFHGSSVSDSSKSQVFHHHNIYVLVKHSLL